jgi:hypothetical protein
MECTVRFSNGITEDFATIQAAAASLLESYPDGVIYDAGGDDHDADDSDGRYEIRNCRAALVWTCEADSADDDGARSVAEIVVAEVIA